MALPRFVYVTTISICVIAGTTSAHVYLTWIVWHVSPHLYARLRRALFHVGYCRQANWASIPRRTGGDGRYCRRYYSFMGRILRLETMLFCFSGIVLRNRYLPAV